ncbi:P63C domain-containing protein [Sphingobacterium bovisgrunnientis]|uniref:P63C domain-containing protein n=1 Tax=Sphingobacterium bovisgrunnientis TaxID=1874697 RepID=UPI00135CD87D|nr:P63C domain-containing protein [Sphingobacterium bovisgrunnientis]
MRNRNIKGSKQLPMSKKTSQDILKDEKQSELQFIFDNLNHKIESKFSDKSLDFESQKIQLFSGKIISEEEILNRRVYLLKNVATYEKMFPQEFYDNIFRLNHWQQNKNKTLRPSVVGKYTNFCIYARFDKSILPQLQSINPYIEFGIRQFKHFQWLNEDGRQQLLVYIQQSIDMMKECTEWNAFVQKYGAKYNIPVQSQIEFN